VNLLRDLGADAWLLLFALYVGDTVEVAGGVPCAVVTGRDGFECRARLEPDVLDRLEAESLIEHHGDTVRPTDRGKYWLGRWIDGNLKGATRRAATLLTLEATR
jgi:hypothetical protein